MMTPLAAMTAIQGRIPASHRRTGSPKSIARPMSHNVKATMHAVGGFMLEMRSTSVPIMLLG